MLEPLLFFGGTLLVTAMVAVLLCHYRFAHKKRISWGTVFGSSLIANAGVFLGMAFYEEGWHVFTREAWTGGKGGLDGALIVLAVIITLCFLPALGVAVYYERRSRRNEKAVG